MKLISEKIKPTRSPTAIDIACDEWQVDESFEVAIGEQRTGHPYEPVSPVFILPDGFHLAALPANTENSLNTYLMEESLC